MTKNKNLDVNKVNKKPNEFVDPELIYEVCSTPYKMAMMCHPVLFDQFNNSANSIISAFSQGNTVLYPKKKDLKKGKVNFFFFSEFGFIFVKAILGGGPLSSAKENREVFVERFKKDKEKNYTDFFCFYPQSSLLGDIPVRNFLLSKQLDFQKSDFALSNNKTGVKMINNLMKLPCQVNVPIYKYVIENLHCLVEIGILPPLEVSNSPNIKENKRELSQTIEIWYDLHKDLLALDEKKKKTKIIFTGKKIFLTECNFPHSLDKKFEEVLFKTKKTAFLSLHGISESHKRSLKTTQDLINGPAYFSMKYDTRGRIYYRTEFSPLQRPFGRNLLRFIKPTLIKTSSKQEFIFFAMLGMSIKKHSSYRDAFAFVCKNKTEIIESLNNFYWTTFQEPWVSLNYILEFKRYFEQPEKTRNLGVELFIQIELDASSSVLQINSVLSTNISLARAVCQLN